MNAPRVTPGATYLGDGRCRFLVWAPRVRNMEVMLLTPKPRVVALTRLPGACHEGVVEGVAPGTRYLYRLDGRTKLPDPASRFQPDGVHGASAVVDSSFSWTDARWPGIPWQDYILYELHVGTFTPQGTFEAIIRRLAQLKDLGVTAVELMPVAQFPGNRNWGYDGVYPYAVQNSYGGPVGLKRLVNAAHGAGLAVVLDVVYNHLGPEGNCLGAFGPYFKRSHPTPWGQALNFDGPHSDGVRRFFIENALYWQTEFHLDALRLDAIHAIGDSSAVPVLEEMAEACRRKASTLKRPFHLIGESGVDIVRRVPGRALAGPSLDGEWRDDFHHCLHVLLTRERIGYYAPFGGVAQFARVWKAAHADQSVAAVAPNRRRKGAPPPAKAAVVYSQNHDQVGNRLRGERLAALVSFEAQKLAAATVLLSPFIPLLFMGEEYGETAPFQYFVSHSRPALVRAVRAGRQAELATSGWRGKPPDPQNEVSFVRSKLNRILAGQLRQRLLREWYRELLRLRSTAPALAAAAGNTMNVRAHEREQVLLVNYARGADRILAAFNYSDQPATAIAAVPPGRWVTLLNSAGRRWGGHDITVVEEIDSPGRVQLSLSAKSVLVLRSKPPSRSSRISPPPRKSPRRSSHPSPSRL